MSLFGMDLLGALLLIAGSMIVASGLTALISAAYYRQRWEQWREDNSRG